MIDAHQLAVGVSWVATAIGAGLWLWSWIREKDAIRKLRFLDCAVVLLFASVLLRIVAQDKPMMLILFDTTSPTPPKPNNRPIHWRGLTISPIIGAANAVSTGCMPTISAARPAGMPSRIAHQTPPT